MTFAEHWQPHKLESNHDMYFQAKSSEITEELTATAPLQFGRQSMNGTEKTQCVPALSKPCETRAIAKLAKQRTGQICVLVGYLHDNFTIADFA